MILSSTMTITLLHLKQVQSLSTIVDGEPNERNDQEEANVGASLIIVLIVENFPLNILQ